MKIEESIFPMVRYDQVSLDQANMLLLAWGHRMGPLKRGNQRAVCHALIHEGHAVAVTTASTLIAPVVGGGCNWMNRDNTPEPKPIIKSTVVYEVVEAEE